LLEEEFKKAFDPENISNPPRPLDYAYGVDLKIDLSSMESAGGNK
jgi:hypothetical protein